MHVFANVKILGAVALAVLMVGSQPVLAANYPLTITNIKPAGTGGFRSNHRIFRAYPGSCTTSAPPSSVADIPTSTPFRRSRGDDDQRPDGRDQLALAADQRESDSHVVDSEGTRVEATWAITVGTAGFKFIDAVNGRASRRTDVRRACGTGTVDNPWRTPSDSTAAPRRAKHGVYFKQRHLSNHRPSASGCRRCLGARGLRDRNNVGFLDRLPRPDAPHRLRLHRKRNGAVHSDLWFDVYVDGFETRHSRIMAFQFSSVGHPGPTFRKPDARPRHAGTTTARMPRSS